MSNKERRTMDFEVRVEEKEGESPKIVGHAAVFDQETVIAGLFREVIRPGAFTRAVKEDDVRALWNHDANFVLGRTKSGTLKLREDKTGLHMEVTPPDTQTIRDLVMEPIRRGDVTQQSFGFTIPDGGEEWRDDEVESGKLPLREITDTRLWDVSPVTYPAYEGTDVAVRSHDEYIKTKKNSRNSINHKKRKLKLMEVED